MDHLTHTAERSASTGKHILFVSPYWLENHRWMISSVKLAELWQRMGYRVTVVCMGSQTRMEIMSETLTIHFVRDFFLPDPLNYGIAAQFTSTVLRVAAGIKPDLVIINKVLFWSSRAIFRLKRAGYRVIVTTDALVGRTWQPRGFFSRIIMSVGARLVGDRVLRAADQIVFFHPQPADLLHRLGIAKRSRVIPSGIDAAHFHHDSSDRMHNECVITYIGRLESVKGVDDFLAAAVRVKERNPAVKIQVVGWCKDRHRLMRQYAATVAFLGLRSDIPDLLKGTDIFVLPSYSEGLSNALMEAMASGCACIATRVGGNAFLIEEAASGLLFAPGDRTTLQRHLEKLIADPEERKRLSHNAQRRIREMFDWAVVMNEYQKLFKDFLR
jgi:glycosyltransferase involved in cell wall biosynthesis